MEILVIAIAELRLVMFIQTGVAVGKYYQKSAALFHNQFPKASLSKVPFPDEMILSSQPDSPLTFYSSTPGLEVILLFSSLGFLVILFRQPDTILYSRMKEELFFNQYIHFLLLS